MWHNASSLVRGRTAADVLGDADVGLHVEIFDACLSACDSGHRCFSFFGPHSAVAWASHFRLEIATRISPSTPTAHDAAVEKWLAPNTNSAAATTISSKPTMKRDRCRLDMNSSPQSRINRARLKRASAAANNPRLSSSNTPQPARSYEISMRLRRGKFTPRKGYSQGGICLNLKKTMIREIAGDEAASPYNKPTSRARFVASTRLCTSSLP